MEEPVEQQAREDREAERREELPDPRHAQQERRRRRSQLDPAAILRDLQDLRAGAPVVHAEYGVGRYVGLQPMQVAGEDGEFLVIEYAGGDRIYVPVTKRQTDIYVHAKVSIVDDRLLRVGSSNLNNRSLGLDSECDVIIDAALDANRDTPPAIAAIRRDDLSLVMMKAPQLVNERKMCRSGRP